MHEPWERRHSHFEGGTAHRAQSQTDPAEGHIPAGLTLGGPHLLYEVQSRPLKWRSQRKTSQGSISCVTMYYSHFSSL